MSLLYVISLFQFQLLGLSAALHCHRGGQTFLISARCLQPEQMTIQFEELSARADIYECFFVV